MQSYREGKFIRNILMIGAVFLILYYIAIQYGWLGIEHKYYWSMVLIVYVLILSFVLSLALIAGGCLALGCDRGWLKSVVIRSGFDLSNKWLLTIPSGLILIALGACCVGMGALLIYKLPALSQLLEVKFLL